MSQLSQHADFLNTDPLATAARLDSLAADLRRLASGRRPTATELQNAPVLHNWGMLSRPCFVLTGTVHGHPLIAEGHPAVTAELFAIDRTGTWARTMSRYYRLSPGQMEHVDD